jgi:hypothetical protein
MGTAAIRAGISAGPAIVFAFVGAANMVDAAIARVLVLLGVAWFLGAGAWMIAHRHKEMPVAAATDRHALALVFRPTIDAGQMLFQDTGLLDAQPDGVHKDFVARVSGWENEAKAQVAKHADDYSDVLSKAISGDIHLRYLPGWEPPFSLQRRRLNRALRVLRAIAEGTPAKDIDLDIAQRRTVTVTDPNEITRAFHDLWSEGGSVLEGFAHHDAYQVEATAAALGAFEAWAERCRVLITLERPACLPAFRDAQDPHRGDLGDVLPLDLDDEVRRAVGEHRRATERVRAVLDRIVRGQDCAQSSNPAISSQVQT